MGIKFAKTVGAVKRNVGIQLEDRDKSMAIKGLNGGAYFLKTRCCKCSDKALLVVSASGN